MLSERNHKMVDDSAVQIFVVREDEDACALEGGTGECLRYARVAKKNPALLVAKTVCAWRWPNRRSRPIQADPAHRGLPSFFFSFPAVMAVRSGCRGELVAHGPSHDAEKKNNRIRR